MTIVKVQTNCFLDDCIALNPDSLRLCRPLCGKAEPYRNLREHSYFARLSLARFLKKEGRARKAKPFRKGSGIAAEPFREGSDKAAKPFPQG